jgi:hypothetical protein
VTAGIKLTANKPAADIAFRHAPFVTLRPFGDSAVQVRGSERGPSTDTFAAERRPRGGIVIMVVGEAAIRLRQVLHPTVEQPFYALQAVDGLWFRLAGPARSIARHIPSLRIWPRLESFETERPILDAAALVGALREAEAVWKSQTAGRPTREAAAARDLLRAFDAEAYRMGWVKGDAASIFEAINLLEAYVESLLSRRRTTGASIARVRTAIRFAEHSDSEIIKNAFQEFLALCLRPPPDEIR